MKRQRAGSVHSTAAGTVVQRRAHLWTPPTPSATPQSSAGLQRTPEERRRVEHLQALSEWADRAYASPESHHHARADFGDYPKKVGSSFFDNRFRTLHGATRQIDRQTNNRPFLRKWWRPFEVKSYFRRRHNTIGTPKEVVKLLQRADTATLLAANHEAARRVIHHLHEAENPPASSDQPDLEKCAHVVALMDHVQAIEEELARRSLNGDEVAISHFEETKSAWKMANEEMDTYGKAYVSPARHKMTANEVAEYVGCTKDELAVYVWSDMLEPAPPDWNGQGPRPEQSNNLDDLKFWGSGVMGFKQTYNDQN